MGETWVVYKDKNKGKIKKKKHCINMYILD